jgi:geranylgeranyl pyrophosphate synthase
MITSDPDVLSKAWDYGIHLGLIKQVADDIESFAELDNGRSDLVSGRWTLPVAYTMEILPEMSAVELKDCL